MAIASGCRAIRSAGLVMDNIAAVILAGGKSSRMGQDKATLPMKGTRLIDVVADAIRQAGVQDIYVSGKVDGYVSLPDLFMERGPMGGICSCVARLGKQYARLIFVPVDMPHMSSELLQMLIAQSATCHFKNHPLPCFLPLGKKTMRRLEAAARSLARKQTLSVKSFLAALGATAIATPEYLQTALTNTNTPQQWQEAMKKIDS